MEDNINTIIYIILIALMLIGSMIKKRKKARPSVANQTGEPSTSPESESQSEVSKAGRKIENIFSAILEDQFPESKPFAEEEEVEKQEKAEIDVEPETTETVNFSDEGKSVFSKDDPSTQKIETGLFEATESSKYNSSILEELSSGYYQTEEKTELENLISEFDIKKAVIFSEIFKPKYFQINEQ